MKKYTTEGKINFFEELYKSLDDDENEEDNINMCLITNEPLTDKFVQLKCSHKFNYHAIYKDLVTHKAKFNKMESSSGWLKENEIRCPYCRKKLTQQLPYYEELGLQKVIGVNYSAPSNAKTNSVSKCEFLIENPLFNPLIPEELANYYNLKFSKCPVYGTPIKEYKGNFVYENYNDEKCYCWEHKKQMIKGYKKQISDKVKEENIYNKIKEKEEKQKAKAEEKQKAKQKEKEEKQKAKEELKKAVIEAKNNKKPKPKSKPLSLSNVEGENVLLGMSTIANITQPQEPNNNDCCIEIIKSGVKKGTPCCRKIFDTNTQSCLRHYKLYNKVI